MKKLIVLHGATNCKSSNYGDYLYGELIYKYLKEKSYNVIFYQPSDFFKKHIPGYTGICGRKNPAAVLYVPGGYFGEGHNASFRENIIHFLRFMPLGIWASFRHTPMAVIGVGAGPNNCRLLTYGVKRICNHSEFVSVRDNISYEAIKVLCPKANLYNCSDLIVSSLPYLRQNNTKQISEIIKSRGNRKILLIHYSNNRLALSLFAKAAKAFIKSHPDYFVVVSSDSCLENEYELFSRFKEIFGEACGHFNYDDPAEFTALLQQADMVLTCKLHVGVVSCCYGKSVIAAACHPEKTKRFYEQISTPDRCVSLFETTTDELSQLLEKFYLAQIRIPDSLINKAQMSWTLLDNFLNTLDR
ncbi:MAG: polysaccharide pyruvyl transferase family protein [Eubacteriales bacterium]|nr:polysaccharide pyruvyl transferase family protein [Eubacteriales bacterium]MDD4474335.1 polysaccharide pyruvyl transferase family protein [Eubacteriales bacterium]